MDTPFHFDLEQLDAHLRKQIKVTCDQARAKARNDADRALVDMQEELNLAAYRPVQLQLVHWKNEGRHPMNMAQALGSLIGSLVASFLSNEPNEAGALMLQCADGTTARLMSGETADGSHQHESEFHPTRGGHA